jgi:hypothetical protein
VRMQNVCAGIRVVPANASGDTLTNHV